MPIGKKPQFICTRYYKPSALKKVYWKLLQTSPPSTLGVIYPTQQEQVLNWKLLEQRPASYLYGMEGSGFIPWWNAIVSSAPAT